MYGIARLFQYTPEWQSLDLKGLSYEGNAEELTWVVSVLSACCVQWVGKPPGKVWKACSLSVSVRAGHRVFTSSGRCGSKPHRALTNWVHRLGGILHLPAKCGYWFGCCWTFFLVDKTGRWGTLVCFFSIKEEEKEKKVSKKALKVAVDFWIISPVNLKVPRSLLWVGGTTSPLSPPPDIPLKCKCRAAWMTIAHCHGKRDDCFSF